MAAQPVHASRQALIRVATTLRTPSTLQHKWTLAERFLLPIVTGPFLRTHKARLTTNLRKLGLQYTDSFVEFNDDVVAAVSRLSPHDAMIRHRRMKRAVDLDVKKEWMPDHMRNYDPFEDVALMDLYWDQANRKAEKAGYR